jgi:cell wall-associated NlpC family hydrolase
MKIVLLLALLYSSFSGAEEPQLQSGDIIFQTSGSKQSYAIMWASKSLYSHVGVVEVDGKDRYVIEAISKVSRTPLKKWIQRGRLGRYSVFRYPGLDDQKRQEIVARAKSHLGQGYDIYFTSKSKEIYCSELVDLAFQELGLRIGVHQKVKELDVDNAVVRKLVEKR